jgi:hypothetical protein
MFHDGMFYIPDLIWPAESTRQILPDPTRRPFRIPFQRKGAKAQRSQDAKPAAFFFAP